MSITLPPELQLLKRFADAARDVFLITEAEPFDLPGPRVVYVNAAFSRMTGYEAHEILGKTPRILQGSDSDRETLRRIRGHLKRWEAFRAELLNYRKDGSPFWVEIDVQPLADERGRYTHWVAVQRDVTERKATQKQLEMENLALAQVSDAVIAVDNDYRITYWNSAATRLYGVPAAEAMGKPLASIYTYRWSRPEEESIAMERLREDNHYRGEFVHILPNGNSFPVEGAITRLWGEHGESLGYVGILRDISDRRKVEEAQAKSRQILREVLRTATNRRLMLCDSANELPAPLAANQVVAVTFSDTADLRPLRGVIGEAACAAGLTSQRAADMTMAVHEGVMNALVHARGGSVAVHIDRKRRLMQAWISDTGGGISTDTLHRATLERGFTTSGGFGHGFPMMLTLADRVYLLTDTKGTTVVVEQSETPPAPYCMCFE